GRIAGPDQRGDGDPEHEPAARLTGQPRRDGQHGAPARDETGGDQQRPAALADLVGRPVEAALAIGFSFRPAAYPWAEDVPDRVGDVVADECARRAGEDHEAELLVAGTGRDSAG